MKTTEFITWASSAWPEALAEEWDNPGLISGSLDAEHSKALVTVDITAEVVDEAIKQGCSLIVAHHPLLLGGIDSLRQDDYKGSILATAIKHDIVLFAAHTNADVVSGGVSDALAKSLGIKNPRALDGNTEGHGRVGNVSPRTLGQLLEDVRNIISPTAKPIAFIGELDMPIETVALVAGSGMSFSDAADADVFITSDIKHHPALDFKQQQLISGPKALIDISHYGAESIWLRNLADQLENLGLDASISKVNTDPWDGVV